MGQNGPQNINYSIYGQTFFGHNSALFLRNPIFSGGNGLGRHIGAKGSGISRPDQKDGPMGGPFGSTPVQPLSRKNVCEIFGLYIIPEIIVAYL